MHRTRSKAEDMARSILPSKARKAARESKRALHQQNRARIHNRLNHYKGPAADVCEMYDDEDNDLFFNLDPHNNCRYYPIVSERREADKLNHFVRWAKEVTRGMTEREAHDYMRSLVPEGLIGDHAMTHLYMFSENPYQYGFRQPYIGRRTPLRLQMDAVNEKLYEAVTAIIGDSKALAKLNHNLFHFYRVRNASAERAWLRNYYYGPKPTPEVFEPWTADNYVKILHREVYFRYAMGRDGIEYLDSGPLTKFINEYCKLNLSF